jgi:hypothetical protein
MNLSTEELFRSRNTQIKVSFWLICVLLHIQVLPNPL